MSAETNAFTLNLVRAKKAHACVECAAPIVSGELYERYSVVFDGTAATYKTCEPCAVVRNDLVEWAEDNGMEADVTIGDLRQEMRDYEKDILGIRGK